MARRSSEREAAACPSTWLWLLAGILIGIFLSFLMYLRAWVPQIPEPPATPAQALVPPVAPAPVAAAPTPTPPVASAPARFEFYDMLPKSEVNPPNRPPAEAEIAQAEAAAAAQPLTPPGLPSAPMRPEDFPVAGEPSRPTPALNPPAGSYMVQAASFREQSAAAELLQRLSAQGLTGDIQTAQVNGVNWYRVRVGPYQTPAQASQTQSLLQQQQMQAIVLPIR